MSGSPISEPLSSPSPTPPPSPPRAKGSATHKAQAAQAKAAPPHGLGSDSELSELTEEEQDGAEKRANAASAAHGDRAATGDESAGGTSVGGGASTSTSTSLSRRAAQKVLSTTGKRRRGRKKRSSLVPAPMWDWAGTKAYKEQEEEEEEEMPGPPEVMEEEEDEEEGEVEEEDEDKGTGSHHPATPSIARKSKGKKVASRTDIGRDGSMEVDVPRGFEPKLNGALALSRGIGGSGAGGNEEEEEEAESEEDESEDDKNAQNQSDGASDSDEMKWKGVSIPVFSRGRAWMRRRNNAFGGRRRAVWTNQYDYGRAYQRDAWKLSEDDSGSSKGSDDEGVENEDDTENENEKDEGDLDKEEEDNDQDPPPEDIDPSETTQAVGDYPNLIISSAALKATSSPPNSLARIGDPTGPLVEAIAPIAAAAAASSIMAGSQVIDPASPANSTFSRFHSPEPTSTKNAADSLKRKNAKVKEPEGDYDGSLSGPKTERKEKILKHVPPSVDLEVDPAELEGDGDNEPSAAADADEHEVEQEQEVDVENELEAVEAEEPSPDDDLEVELESDLQPAHRAEALDVLATIELKFALLRERVYVEKMEGLAWEEKLVNDGTHPELIHIQKELLKRRDRRLELAARKREYELANISKKRRTNEDLTWSWWKLARDDLQTDMVAETSRKRRRLERERRASEKPQPIPHVPMPPSEVPPAPSLRKIVKSFPFVEKQKTRNSQSTPKAGDYPELLGLTPSEINSDLEVFFSGRRGYDFRGNPVIGFPAPIAPPLGFPGYEGYSDHMGNPMVPPNRIHPQHGPPFTHQMPPPQGYAYPSPNNGRMPPNLGHGHPLPPHPPPPLHAGPSGSSMYPMDEMMGPVPHSAPPHHYYGSQVNGGPYPEGAPPHPPPMAGPPGHHGRRSPSPVNAVVNGKQPHSVWVGPGIPPGTGAVPVGPGGYPGPGQGRSNREWVPGDDRRRDYPMGSEEEERERMMREREQRDERREYFDRERDKQREQREKERDRENMMMEMDRERHMQMMAQHRQGPPASGPPSSASMHSHAHGMPGQHHPMVGHHHSRPHHHHVVHHHHHHGGPPPPASVMHSPRTPREYGEMGPSTGHGQYPTEVINLSSKLGPPPPHRDEFPSNREIDFREKEAREKERARISRRSSPVPGPSSHSQSQIPGPLQTPGMESDRPIPTPFAMASTQTMQGSGSVNGASSPRLSSAYDGHLRSPGHGFPNTGRSIPPTAGPSTPSAVHPPSLPSSRDGSALSPSRRPPPPQSPPPMSESLRERDPEAMGGSGSVASLVPSSSPIQKSPGPVKFGPPPPPSMTLGSSTNVAERERASGASSSGMSGAMGPFSSKSSSVGSKVRPGSPISQAAKAPNNQPLVNSRVGLSGPGRAGTPVGPEKKGPFASPSARSANGAVGGYDGEEKERDKEREKHRMLDEGKLLAGPGPLTPPTSLISSANASAPASSPVALTSPSKMSVPQMVDGP